MLRKCRKPFSSLHFRLIDYPDILMFTILVEIFFGKPAGAVTFTPLIRLLGLDALATGHEQVRTNLRPLAGAKRAALAMP